MRTAKHITSFILLIAFLFTGIGCNSSEEKQKEQANDPSETIPKKKTEQTKSSSSETHVLPQKGDYTALFGAADCNDVLSVEDLTTVYGQSATKTSQGTRCYYSVKRPGFEDMNVGLSVMKMSKKGVAKEIKNYKENERFLTYLLNEKEDTYLCLQAPQGRLIIYNPLYENAVLIVFGGLSSDIRSNSEEKEERKQLGIDLANHILNKY